MQLLYRFGHQSGLSKQTFVLLASFFSVHYYKPTVIDRQLGKLDAIVHLLPAPKSIHLLGTIYAPLSLQSVFHSQMIATPKVLTITSCVASPSL